MRADCQILLTDETHRGLLEGAGPAEVQVFEVGSEAWSHRLAAAPELSLHREATPATPSC